jgi:hypothetical protein
LAVDLDRVRKALRSLDGERALRNLLGRELGYEHQGVRVSGDSYPEELEGDPTLFATAGREGRFSVIHTSFNTPGGLSLMAERKVMERLRNRYPYSLHIFSDAEGKAYVFCRAGEHRLFYAVDAAGEAKEISTQRFLGALRCEPTEVGLRTFPSGHNAAVSAAKKSFTRHLERVRAQQAGQSELPRSQRYAVKQLRELYGQLGSEERRERIERLEEVFRFETNMAARRELNEIHRARLTGDDLVEALERLYIKYRLREAKGDSRELRRRGEADLVARIVVSEAIGRA